MCKASKKLCWCGSGKKYNKCHQNRSKEKPLMEHEIQAAQKKKFGKRYCLHPNASPQNCQGNIVKAHTIQRGGGLTNIAQNGHVYTCGYAKSNSGSQNRQFGVELIGINLASTFTGFCSYHDNQIFSPIEDHTFQSNQEHTFLLGYRAVCNEIFMKRAALELVPFYKTLDRGKDIFEQMQLQHDISAWEAGIKLSLRELEPLKTSYDDALLRSDYLGEHYYVVRFDRTPDVLCSGTVQPDYDFDGNFLQDWGNENAVLEHVTFSLIAANNGGGAAVFSWLGNSDAAKKLIQSLNSLPDDQLPHAVVRFTFEYFENSYFSPIWWDNLGSSVRDMFLARQLSTFATQRNPACLRDDGMRAVSWTIISRETSITL